MTGRARRLGQAIGVGILALAAASGSRPQAQPAAQRLDHAGSSIEGRLAPGETHRLLVQVPGPTYLAVSAQQEEIDLALRLLGPGGETLAEADVPARPWLPERLYAVCLSPGPHRLEIIAGEGAAHTGGYRLTVDARRPARQDDPTRVEAQRARQRGLRLLEEGGEERARQALEIFRAALERVGSLDDPALEGRLRHAMGGALSALGENSEAIASLRQAARQSRQAGDLEGAVETLNRLGQRLQDLGEMDDARTSFSEALTLAREIEDPAWTGRTLNDLGVLEYALGRTDEAIARLREALPLRRAAGDQAGLATTLANLGVIQRRLGNLDEALAAYQEAGPLAERLGDTESELSIANNLGVLYRVRGEMQRALEIYTEAIDRAHTAGSARWEATLRSNLGRLYLILGDPSRALDQHQQALALFRGQQLTSAVAAERMRIGALYETTERFPEAREQFELALPIARDTQDRRTETLLYAAIGRVQLASGQLEEAERELERALAMAIEISDLASRAGILRDLGRVRLSRDDPAAARAALEEARRWSRTIGNPYQEAAVGLALARVERRSGRLAEAQAEAEGALATIESLRAELASAEIRASFLSRRQGDYRFLADLLLDRHRRDPAAGFDRAAFQVSERARARSLVEQLSEAIASNPPEVHPELAERERQVRQQLAWAQRELIRLLSRPQPPADQVGALRQEVDRLQHTMERLEWELRREQPRYAELRYPRPLPIDEVQDLLGPGTAILEYLLGEERSLLFVVTRSRYELFELPPESQIAPRVAQAREALQTPGRVQAGRFARLSSELFHLLVAPARSALDDLDHLMVIPDGELYHLPFEALIAQPRASGLPTYLMDRWAVSYVPSASALSAIRRNGRRREMPAPEVQLLAFGDPLVPEAAEATAPPRADALDRDGWRWRRLPFTRQEIEAIAALLPPEQARIYLGPAAQESRLKSEPALSRAPYLHLASHAFVDSSRPAYSSLLMSPEEGGLEDGLLQTHEVFRLRLAARLVVLSACDTGLGKEIRGEGLVGLYRAFIYAGAEAVAVSLWPVADRSTAELMGRFYRYLWLEKQAPAEALRSAKASMLRDRRFVNPNFWAPFVLIGDAAGGHRDVI